MASQSYLCVLASWLFQLNKLAKGPCLADYDEELPTSLRPQAAHIINNIYD